jgi:hypothetical protein
VQPGAGALLRAAGGFGRQLCNGEGLLPRLEGRPFAPDGYTHCRPRTAVVAELPFHPLVSERMGTAVTGSARGSQ